jgi:hypothetical protein
VEFDVNHDDDYEIAFDHAQLPDPHRPHDSPAAKPNISEPSDCRTASHLQQMPRVSVAFDRRLSHPSVTFLVRVIARRKRAPAA